MNTWILGGFVACLLAAEQPVDFSTEIIPTLTKAGCNGGNCHGAAAGRGGFRLSLLGANPAADYDAVVRDFEGRRVHRLRPQDSLLLTKPLGQVDHGGGAVLELDSAAAHRLRAWIEQGALPSSVQPLTKLDVVAASATVVQAGSPNGEVPPGLMSSRFLLDPRSPMVEVRVLATFSGGATRDVTHLTLFTPVDPTAVQLADREVPNSESSENSRQVLSVKVLRLGRQVVVARYLDQVVPLVLDVPRNDGTRQDGPRHDSPASPASALATNWIDAEVDALLANLRIPRSDRADDSTFLRRLFLDLTGRLPTPEQSRRYGEDPAPNKAERMVDELLASEAFVDYWTWQLARWLRLHSLPNESEATAAYARWLRQQVQDGRPFDKLTRDLLLATGDSHEVGPANFSRMVADARGQAEFVGQVFLGVRLGCANCHDHPLDRWKQDDYHGLAAVFARVDRGRHVRLAPRGAVTNPRTGEPAVPRIPGERDLSAADDSRIQLADWLLAKSHRPFPRAIVNRLWGVLFGRGIVDPVDDMRATNPPTHPELLERLTTDFVEHGYNLRHTLRLMATSETYARSAVPVDSNRQDVWFYSRALERPLPAEVLADLLDDVTGVPTVYPDQPPGTRAIHIVDPLAAAPTLDLLGRCSRSTDCQDEGSGGRGMATYLHLLNGELLNDKIASPEGRLHRLLAAGRSDSEVIVEFYWRGLSRAPTSRELADWLATLQEGTAAADERTKRFEDFLWSLLSCHEFTHR